MLPSYLKIFKGSTERPPKNPKPKEEKKHNVRGSKVEIFFFFLKIMVIFLKVQVEYPCNQLVQPHGQLSHFTIWWRLRSLDGNLMFQSSVRKPLT